ncbi:MAG: hypothetical protein ABEL04_04700 [Salinibacter sp.]|uniref:hypothetical protein n=1 Tax=Salinibacter sp. TaxID=2065818 RepID=UPI0035D455DD
MAVLILILVLGGLAFWGIRKWWHAQRLTNAIKSSDETIVYCNKCGGKYRTDDGKCPHCGAGMEWGDQIGRTDEGEPFTLDILESDTDKEEDKS